MPVVVSVKHLANQHAKHPVQSEIRSAKISSIMKSGGLSTAFYLKKTRRIQG